MLFYSVLSKVLLIVSYDFPPSLWQFLDSSSKEILIISERSSHRPIFALPFSISEAFFSISKAADLHRSEQMIVTKSKV